jgi:hypothetical protein
MTRYRPSPLGRWLNALAVATAYVVIATALFWLDLGDAGVVPAWAIVAVPPFYGVVSLLMLHSASPAHRLRWIGGACLTHLALGMAAATVFCMVVDVTALSALAHAFARIGPVPALTLIATPLVLAPFRGRVLSPRPVPRSARLRQPGVLPPATTLEPAAAREPHHVESSPEPTPAPAPGRAAEPVSPPPPPPRAAKPTAPPKSSRAAEPVNPVVDPDDDGVVRIRFERVAAQLPAGVFTLPPERLSESLREPHWLTVPRRVVLAQLPEGAVQVDWAVIASQFPPLALAMSDVEFRAKFPDLKLTLPLDDVLRQLPPGTIAMEPTPRQIAGLDAFPAPFQPLSVPREVADDTPSAPRPRPASEHIPRVAATTAIKPPTAEPARVAPPPTTTRPVMTPPPVVTPPPVMTPPPPLVAPPPLVTPPPPVVMPPPPPVVAPPPPPAPAPPVARQAPAPSAWRDVGGDVINRDALARLAACLAGAGTFESWSGVVDGTALVAFVAPTVVRDAVTAVAARVAQLLGAAAGEQVTVRTARAAIIVSAAPTPVVIAARRPGAPVALLELRATRAAGLAGRASEGGVLPLRALSTVTVEPRVASVAGTLTAFGIVEPAVLTDTSGGARVYVFREPGREADRLAALALAVWEGLGRTHDGDLGALVSVVFRQGRRRILVRPVGGRGTALLAAAGPVARPGRAWRDADRAAAALETR